MNAFAEKTILAAIHGFKETIGLSWCDENMIQAALWQGIGMEYVIS